MSITVLNTYPISDDFNNSLTVPLVAASAGNVIVVFASGRNNSFKSNFTAPTWNGETFAVAKEFVTTDPTSIEIFVRKCVSTGVFNIVLPSDQYTGCHGHAVVLAGNFGSSFYDTPVSKFVAEGAYSLPTIDIPNMVSGDVALNALLATAWSASFDDVSSTTHTTNGTQLALTETVQPGSRRMYSAENTGVGTVTASYSKSNSGQPQYTMVGFRLYEEASGIILVTTPSDVRVTESRTIRVTAPTTAMTTGNTTVKINSSGNSAITPSAVTNISGLTYDVVFTVPDEYAGLPYSATGYGIIVSTADGNATSANVPFLPVIGNYVTLTDVSATDIESSPALEVDDQVEWTNAADIEDETPSGIIIGADGRVTSYSAATTYSFRVWDHNDSTWGDWAEATFGDSGSSEENYSIADYGIANYGVANYGLGG